MQQVLQQLLARLDAWGKEMNTNQEKAEANAKANQDLLARMEAKMETKRERDRDNLKGMMAETNTKMDGKQEEMLARMREDIESGQAEMKSTICAFQSELEETIQQETKDFLLYVSQKMQNLRSELTETIKKALIELHTVEVSLDKRTRDIEEKIASIKGDITSSNQKFQSQLEEVKAFAKQGSRPTVGTNTAQPPTFNRNISWSVFWRQFEIIAKHNHRSDWEKLTYLITALKGWAADMLPSIPTNTT
jgi:hypothetical protein